jgi:hypothetical protein
VRGEEGRRGHAPHEVGVHLRIGALRVFR